MSLQARRKGRVLLDVPSKTLPFEHMKKGRHRMITSQERQELALPSGSQQNGHSEPLLTFKEAMAYLRVSRSTLYRLIESDRVIGHKVGST